MEQKERETERDLLFKRTFVRAVKGSHDHVTDLSNHKG